MVDEEIMLIGEIFIVGDGGVSGNIPISEGYLSILTPTCL